MKPKSPANDPQLFQSRLENILNLDHELCQLADKIDWSRMEAELAECYDPRMGRPGCSTRLLVGLHYLKHAFDESDESVMARWVENPYWQYFCGFEFMQHDCPRGNWIVATQALHGNPYDGHTLAATVGQAERWIKRTIREIFVDRGYRGHDYQGAAVVHQVGRLSKSITSALRKKLRPRSAIEPTISHLKHDNRLERNHLKGKEGDRLHAVLCAAGYNLRKLLSAFLRVIYGRFFLLSDGNFSRSLEITIVPK